MKRVAAIRHAGTKRAAKTLASAIRRGPPTASATPLDLAFKIGSAGVMIAAVVLGVALGLARPTWALAAAMLAVGALLAAVVVLRPFSVRGGESASS